jgi:hypothetical protein
MANIRPERADDRPELPVQIVLSGFPPASRSKILEPITFMILDRFDPKSS